MIAPLVSPLIAPLVSPLIAPLGSVLPGTPPLRRVPAVVSGRAWLLGGCFSGGLRRCLGSGPAPRGHLQGSIDVTMPVRSCHHCHAGKKDDLRPKE